MEIGWRVPSYARKWTKVADSRKLVSYFKSVDENNFKLSVTANDQFPYNLKTEKFNKILLANNDVNETYQFGKKIE